MKYYCAPALWLFLISTPAAYSKNSYELDPIIVTANRLAESADESLTSVTVISQADIQRRQASNLEELLQGIQGLNMSNNGGEGKATSLFIRGTESDHILVLINGAKVGSASLGTTAFQHIPISQVDRIEIVRGPKSSLYGSEAIGGVIQIFTRKGGDKMKYFADVGVGSYQRISTSAGLSGGGDNGWFNVSVDRINTDGFDACRGKPSPGGAGCFTDEPDSDGYTRLSSALRFGYRLNHQTDADFYLLHTTGDNQYDGSFVNESEFVQQLFGGKIAYSINNSLNMSLSYSQSIDESDNLKDSGFQSRFKTKRQSVSIQGDVYFLRNQSLSGGIDYLNDIVDGNISYEETERMNVGIFAQYQGEVFSNDYQLSFRADENEQFGTHTTGGIAVGRSLNRNLRLFSSIGTAYKSPTFNELYFPSYGNPKLDPEKSWSVETGFIGKINNGKWSINLFNTQIENLIVYDAASSSPKNIEKTQIYGVELALTAHIRQWRFSTNITIIDPINKSNAAKEDRTLPRRAKQSLQFDVDYEKQKYQFGSSVQVMGKRYDDLANTRELDAYATIDLRAKLNISKDWQIQTRMNNLFNKEYETASYFNQIGRSYLVSLRFEH